MALQYTKKVMNHFMNPKFKGEIKNCDAIGKVGNPACGDIMHVFLKIDPKTEKIKDIKFQTMGCVAAIATSDALCMLAKGKTLTQAEKITGEEIIKSLGELPSIKVHCSVLGERALKKAIENYKFSKTRSKR